MDKNIPLDLYKILRITGLICPALFLPNLLYQILKNITRTTIRFPEKLLFTLFTVM